MAPSLPLWNPGEAAELAPGGPEGPPLGALLHASRLLGSRPELVQPGTGNSSWKGRWSDGRPTLWVKGSGRDLARLAIGDLAPVDLAAIRPLLAREAVPDEEVGRALCAARLDPSAPPPSVETLLHALLPHPAVLHGHPAAVLDLTWSEGGLEVARRLWGDTVPLVPWHPPGHRLMRAVRREIGDRDRGSLRAIVLLEHGLFTFADRPEVAWSSFGTLVAEAAAAWEALPVHSRRRSPGPREAAPAPAG